MEREVSLIIIKNPFNRKDRDIKFISYKNQSLSNIIEEHIVKDIEVIASINGKIIPKEKWNKTFLKENDQIVIVPKVQGGKDVVSNVLSVAVAVAAVVTGTWVSGVVSGALKGAVSAGVASILSSAAGILAATAVSYVGGTLITSLFPPPKPKLPNIDSLTGYDTSPTYSWTPQTTQQQGTIIPFIYGQTKVYGNIISTYIQNIENKQYLNVLICLGLGPISEISDIYINDQPVSDYKEVTVETRLGHINQSPISTFNNTKIEYLKSLLVSYNNPVLITTNNNDFNSLEIDITCPQGLWHQNNRGGLDTHSVKIRIKCRKQGDTDWFYSKEYTISGNQTSPIRVTYPIPDIRTDEPNLPEFGVYEIQVEKLTPDQTDIRYGDEVYVSAIREVYYDDFEYPGLALVGIRALATDQLSGNFRFSCIVKGRLVRIWDGENWKVEWTDNPAWICYDILTQPIFDDNLNVVEYRGINPERIDYEKFKEWADYCDELVPDGKGGYEKRCTFNGIFDTEMNMWDAVSKVCEIGRASLVWHGSKLTVAIDKPSFPVQMFTVGNIIEGTFKETFLSKDDRVGEVEINYIDKNKDYERTVLTVFDSELNTNNKLSLNVFGITKESEAYRYGLYRLYMNKYINRVVEFEADIDAIACTIGDVILLQHDIPQWGYGGRIESATENTVTLDREVYIDTSKQYRILIRLSDDTIVERDIVNPSESGKYKVITVSTPFDTIPQTFDLFAFGEVNYETKPFRVLSISKTQEQQVQITAIEYNESIYNVDNLTSVKPTEDYSGLERYPSVLNLSVNEVLLKDSANNLYSVLDIHFDIPTDQPLYSYAEIFLDDGSGAKYVGSTVNNYYRITGIDIGKKYTVIVRSVNIFEQRQPLDKAPSVEIYTLGKLAPPSDVENFIAKQYDLGIMLTWEQVPDVDILGYEIRMGSTWDTGQIIVSHITQNHYFIPKTVDGTYTFWIKAIDTGGRYSINPTQATITVTGVNDKLNIIFEQEELTKASPADGTKTNLVFISPTTSGADVTALTWIQMLTDTDCPNWTDTTPEITNYDGTIYYEGSYETLPCDFGTIAKSNIKIVTEVDSYNYRVIDQTYPDRTDLTYPHDTDKHITTVVKLRIYYSISNDNTNWSDWIEYLSPVDEEFRYIKFKFYIQFESSTIIAKVLKFYFALDVPDKRLKIENLSVPIGGIDITYSDYGVTFITEPFVGVTVLNTEASITPIISNKTNEGFHLDLFDNTNTNVSGNVDIDIKGF